MRRWISVAALTVGLVLMLAAGGVRWIAAPRLAVLPADTDTSRSYTGSAATLFNAKALTAPDAGPVLLSNVPIRVSHRTTVLDTTGNNALVSDSGTVTAAGSPIAGFQYRYAVDRTNMGRGAGFRGVVAQTGITFNFPIHTAKHNYPGWIPDTQSTVPLTYQGSATHAGLSTYVFRTNSTPTPITDPETLKSLPAALPKSTLARLAAGLRLPAGGLSSLQSMLASLPDPVPFSYTYQVHATYWVQPTTGEIVDLREHEVRSLTLTAGKTLVPITPVLDITYTSTPAGLAAAVHDARHDAGLIDLAYRWLPLILLATGLAALLTGAASLLFARRKRHAATALVNPAPAPSAHSATRDDAPASTPLARDEPEPAADQPPAPEPVPVTRRGGAHRAS